MCQHFLEFGLAFVLDCLVECLKPFAGEYDPALPLGRIADIECFRDDSSSGIGTHAIRVEHLFRMYDPISPCCEGMAFGADVDVDAPFHEMEFLVYGGKVFFLGEEFLS